jgi:hypothetical protein
MRAARCSLAMVTFSVLRIEQPPDLAAARPHALGKALVI